MHKVNTPDVVLILWPQSDDRTVFVIQPFTLFVTLRQLQAFLSPQPFHAFVIDVLTFHAQKSSDLTVSVPTIHLGQPDQSQPQLFLIIFRSRLIPEAAPCDANDITRPALRCVKLLATVDNGLT